MRTLAATVAVCWAVLIVLAILIFRPAWADTTPPTQQTQPTNTGCGYLCGIYVPHSRGSNRGL